MRAIKPHPLALAIALIGSGVYLPAQAQQTETLEEVQVLGSYIRGTDTAAANPVSVVNADEMQYAGATDVTDMINMLSVNSGAENRPDTFTSFYSQGTSNVNLRGLGLSSTLVLINGKRQTISGAKAQDGSTFVDTASIPAIAIERIDVLKEGAAAAYGSDAVAGVVNFVTKDDFEGIKLDGSWQSTAKDSQTDKNFSVMAGFASGDTHLVFAASALRRSNLNARKRPELVGAAVSSLGTSFVMSEDVVVASGDWAGSYSAGDNVGNPKCEGEINGVVIDRGDNGNRCGFAYGLHYNIVNEEEREQYYTSVTHDFGNGTEGKVQGFYSNYRIIDNYTVPAYPILTFPTIAADHPDNPFGSPVTYLGRINPTLDPAQSPAAPRDNETARIEMSLNGGFSNGWDWLTALSYSQNAYTIVQPEMSIERINAGLAGTGGPSGDQYLNPFDPTANSPEMLDWLKTSFGSTTETSLLTLDAVFNGEIAQTSAGAVNMAVGAHVRTESYNVDPNEASTISPDPVTGINSRADFIFLGGVNAVDESRNVSALFTEVEVPLSEDFTVNAALRYERLSQDSSLNPKLALLYQATDKLMLRASASTSFREPSLSQFYADTVSTLNVQDYEVSPDGNLVLDGNGQPIAKGGSLFIRRATTGSPDLEPEQATNYNLGVIWVGDALDARLDYWRVDYKDVITIEDAQGKLLADPDGPDIERLDPNDPNSELGGISTNYFNAATINASGIDAETSYNFTWDNSQLTLGLGLSHYLEYEIPINGELTDVSGQFNRGNFARSMPKTKGNLSAHWQSSAHSLYARVNYTASYKNDDDTVDSFAPVDLQYQYAMDLNDATATISVGAINLFDEQPPFVVDGANFSYDPKHHDPRGRIFYVKGSYTF
ncbi:TonB-dependent receptor [Simiduia aestuariiviva]|uniref:Iron complex outermembrane receptor protein n=1 Tax=Simiduia aestuariiviva TaxID=1510459 RepID=A0A839UUS6_9GAMM|nr:TonB-dependent receptor [Simiduia aestuariiviva]MBB3169115.1 iron complex outermembrane receptor protein [Simiduia aestuariiviva]